MNNTEVQNIISQGENELVEFKENFNNDAVVALCAFANTKGGKVYVGISDNGKIKGVEIKQETIPIIINEVKSKTYPNIIPDADFVEIQDKIILILTIKEFPIKPVAIKGKYYKRIKNSNHQLNLQEISDMHLKTFNTSWDSYSTNNYTLDDISIEKINKFIEKNNRLNDFKIEDAPFHVLKKYELIKNEQITNACYLLFAKSDIFSATIELGRFSDPISIKDGLTVRSDLFTQVDEVISFIKKHINKEYIITGNPEREERWQYPISAIREIVVNMIVHRDYTHHGASSIKIYNDKIEFYNAGKLPDSITIEKLLSGNYVSEIRNIKIAGMFKELKLIEKYGSGFSRIIKAFEIYELKPLVFENFQSGFRITIFAEKIPAKNNVVENVVENVVGNVVGNRLDKIINLIKTNNQISASQISKLLNITGRTAQRDIEKLKKQNKIKRIGSDKGGKWEVIL